MVKLKLIYFLFFYFFLNKKQMEGQLTKKKCQQCLKKTLFFNKCKCEKEFCFNCSSYYNHNCNYDYKEN